jgi:L-alanine-DL-glutamate epimerase-like enolase superfamily enzyme
VLVKVEVGSARLRRQFEAAWGSVGERELLLLALEDSEGHVGYGEAAPLPGYDGVTLADVQAALSDCHGALTRASWQERVELLADCARLTVVPQALEAIDLALWDLAGKRAGEPVWRLLGALVPWSGAGQLHDRSLRPRGCSSRGGRSARSRVRLCEAEGGHGR